MEAVLPTVEWVDTVGSTNSELKAVVAGRPHGYVLAARSQTAGRGQRGNSWEATPGENLTFSMLLKPRNLRPSEQFYISEAVALGVAETLEEYLSSGERVMVKWPNDIYVGDRKICGILIENTIAGGGAISYSVAGVGVNINQRRFYSDAPNPVSLYQITGTLYSLEEMLERISERILHRLAQADNPLGDGRMALHNDYHARFWRGNGVFPFRLPDGTLFEASVGLVAPDGLLTLNLADGTSRSFYFKEVAFVL